MKAVSIYPICRRMKLCSYIRICALSGIFKGNCSCLILFQLICCYSGELSYSFWKFDTILTSTLIKQKKLYKTFSHINLITLMTTVTQKNASMSSIHRHFHNFSSVHDDNINIKKGKKWDWVERKLSCTEINSIYSSMDERR